MQQIRLHENHDVKQTGLVTDMNLIAHISKSSSATYGIRVEEIPDMYNIDIISAHLSNVSRDAAMTRDQAMIDALWRMFGDESNNNY